MNKFYQLILAFMFGIVSCTAQPIDRQALLKRNNPQVNQFERLSSLSIGNGGFAFTVDATGLQTFPALYTGGVPLGTQSDWGWHRFANPENYNIQDALKAYDFGHGHKELYATQFNENGRQKAAADWLRINPHRLHLGIIGFEVPAPLNTPSQVKNIHQELDLYNGIITSQYEWGNKPMKVQTTCHSSLDMIGARISSKLRAGIKFHFPYPTGGHSDDACEWGANDKHSTLIVERNKQSVILKRTLDETTYFVKIAWEGKAEFKEKEKNYFVLQPATDQFAFTCQYMEDKNREAQPQYAQTEADSKAYWNQFWNKGAVVDFSHCKDVRAKEMERRVVLSQYLLAIQCAGTTPPQETGLTYNSWFGKFHLEMIWWHQAQFALWNHPELLEHTLSWYEQAYPNAKAIAKRQGFKGIRWMKMTDPSAQEAPSKVGSFLIWQQPHLIYLAELAYRAHPSERLLKKYQQMIEETAEFMADYITYDAAKDRYVLKGCIPAQETLRADSTINPPFELSYWHFALQTAQTWRERTGQSRHAEWDKIIEKLSPLAANDKGLYLAAESATNTYSDIRFTSDHMAVLGALGILPNNKLINTNIMRNTFDWIWDNWNWDKTWGWDYPMTAMCATRLGEPEKAVGALLMNKRTNTYLVSGNNYQDDRLRIYLPGNGGLLTAVALMCAGWDGCTEKNPGFPKDGNWDVRWEGLKPMP